MSGGGNEGVEGGAGWGEGAEERWEVKVGEGVKEDVRGKCGFVEETGARGASSGAGGGGGNGGDIAMPPAFPSGREGP